MNKPIGIYVRVSKKGDREDERFHSPREQRERAEALVRAKGLEPGPTFEDIDVSGAVRPQDRPAMGELLAAIDAGELGGIAAFSLDRLSREPGHGDALVKRVTKAGGIVLTPDIPDAIDTPTGEFTFGMLLQVAKLYRSQAKARFVSATERATLDGIPVAQIPLGYRQRDDRKLEVDPATAPIVREVYERRVAGEGWTRLAAYISEQTGRVWSRAGARTLVKNRLFATGRLEYGAVVSEHDAGAIVDEALWHAAQRAAPMPRPPRSDQPWLLTGLAVCDGCGKKLIPWRGSPRRRMRVNGEPGKTGRAYRRYFCDKQHCQARASVSAEKLEKLVILQTATLEHELSTRGEAADLASLEDAVALTQRRLDQVLAPEARDALGDLWAADVKARRAEHDAALSELGEARAHAGVPEVTFEWADLPPAERRAGLALFWREIRVGRREGGGQSVQFIARAMGATAEVDL